MAGQTDFNVQEYLRSIGSRGGGGDMEFSSRITPTVQLADFSDLTPAHQPPLAVYGGIIPAVATRFTAFQIHSRGKGGTFILDIAFHCAIFQPAKFEITAPVAPFAQIHVPQVASNVAPTSVVSSGTLAADLSPQVPAMISNQFPGGIWIPPGRALMFSGGFVNTAMSFAVTLSDVPVGEGGD